MDTQSLLVSIGKAAAITILITVIAGVILYLGNGDAKEAAKTLGTSINLIVLFFIGMIVVFYKTGKVAQMQPQ